MNAALGKNEDMPANFRRSTFTVANFNGDGLPKVVVYKMRMTSLTEKQIKRLCAGKPITARNTAAMAFVDGQPISVRKMSTEQRQRLLIAQAKHEYGTKSEEDRP